MPTQNERWQERIDAIKRELFELGEMRPGALSKQFNVCGKAGCRCKDSKNPRKHGPYFQVSYTHLGKSTTEFVKAEALATVQEQLANYARFKALTLEWVQLSLRVAKRRRSAK